MLLVKLFRAGEWAAFGTEGLFAGSADDRRDGFIHLSTAAQLAGTRARHFAGETGLVAAWLDVGDDPSLRWEASRGGQVFPHLYRPLRLADVIRHEVLA
jgi:uncharacterized protein (DUF952 family)